MHALQELGATLVTLTPAQLARLDLPERLVDAIGAAKSITRFEARRRQMQFIGKLMRDIDPAPIAAHVQALRQSRQRENARQHEIETWRDRLLAGEDALIDFAARAPGVDTQHLRTLIRNARKERAGGKPPRAERTLYREIRVLLDPSSTPADTLNEPPNDPAASP